MGPAGLDSEFEVFIFSRFPSFLLQKKSVQKHARHTRERKTFPKSSTQYVATHVSVDRRVDVIRPNDRAAALDVAVTCLVHGTMTRYMDKIPRL